MQQDSASRGVIRSANKGEMKFAVRLPGKQERIVRLITIVRAYELLAPSESLLFYGENVELNHTLMSSTPRMIFQYDDGNYLVLPDTAYNRQFWEMLD